MDYFSNVNDFFFTRNIFLLETFRCDTAQPIFTTTSVVNETLVLNKQILKANSPCRLLKLHLRFTVRHQYYPGDRISFLNTHLFVSFQYEYMLCIIVYSFSAKKNWQCMYEISCLPHHHSLQNTDHQEMCTVKGED